MARIGWLGEAWALSASWQWARRMTSSRQRYSSVRLRSPLPNTSSASGGAYDVRPPSASLHATTDFRARYETQRLVVRLPCLALNATATRYLGRRAGGPRTCPRSHVAGSRAVARC